MTLCYMRRKLIELGNNCMVMTLPRKWVNAHGLQKGAELNVDMTDTQLIVRPEEVLSGQSAISLDVNASWQTSTRAFINNAYRAGYDTLNVHYTGDRNVLVEVVEKHLLGFELFDAGKHHYIIESVSEPSADHFEKIFTKRFFMVLTILAHISKRDISKDSFLVQKYDSFLKRSLMKQSLAPKSQGFLWQFISEITHVAIECYHFQQNTSILSQPLHPTLQESQRLVREMFSLLGKAYMKKDVAALAKVHELYFTLIKKDLFAVHPKIAYYIFHIARMIHYATSPLIGLLHLSLPASKSS